MVLDRATALESRRSVKKRSRAETATGVTEWGRSRKDRVFTFPTATRNRSWGCGASAISDSSATAPTGSRPQVATPPPPRNRHRVATPSLLHRSVPHRGATARGLRRFLHAPARPSVREVTTFLSSICRDPRATLRGLRQDHRGTLGRPRPPRGRDAVPSGTPRDRSGVATFWLMAQRPWSCDQRFCESARPPRGSRRHETPRARGRRAQPSPRVPPRPLTRPPYTNVYWCAAVKRAACRQTAHVRADQLEALRLLSARTGRPMADFLRQAVDAVLARHAGPAPTPARDDGDEFDRSG